ncbi:MAG: DUF1800 domain-containing protein [Caldilineae bacterium]|nr:MAG: DUF1800 domain-containing protein [Caldilineae bacterium]
MYPTRREFLKTGGLLALLATGPHFIRSGTQPPIRWRSPQPVLAQDPALHLLRRATFGPTRSELERMRSMGVDAWIEEQLHPELIDDGELEAHLKATYPTLSMDLPDLFQMPPRQVVAELRAATLERALYSKRQLLEVLVDHWSNHFSVDQLKGGCRFSKTWEDREVIRAHALGSFRDLLGADARSPCMLEYLDNYRSTKEAPNENYARELMELHTLGVDGGYTETDVKEVARAFTGWTIARGTHTFVFRQRIHDTGSKVVLGHFLPAGRGIEDGEEVLDLLARHESTSYYVSRRLAQRLVADEPPDNVVTAAAKVFRDTDGDLRAVVRAILMHKAFWTSTGQKLRRPLELLVAAARTLEIPDIDGSIMTAAANYLGQPPFGWTAPNGYPDVAGAWVNTDALLKRWNYGMLLCEGHIPTAIPDYVALLQGVPDHQGTTIVDFFIDLVLHQKMHPEDRDQLIAFLDGDDGPFNANLPHHRRRVPSMVGLIVDSPYFQWR